jgi:release factor glutamine methyltransferase
VTRVKDPSAIGSLDSRQLALVRLGQHLRAQGYRFITTTPETHRRVNGRPGAALGTTLRDIFGWSRPFHADRLSPEALALCQQADVLVPAGGQAAGQAASEDRFTAAVRFSTLTSFGGDHLFVHSAYPTSGEDAVFFGPDSYRFAALLARTVWKANRLVDVGCGTGVGGLVLAPRADHVILTDINPGALDLAAVNVALAGSTAATVSLQVSDLLAQVRNDDPLDVVIANPPYLVDPARRLYRDGGGGLGIDLAARIVSESLARLSPGGQLVLYTGTPVMDGQPVLYARVQAELDERAATWAWEELDPDVFGEELSQPAYSQVERVAAVALVATAA